MTNLLFKKAAIACSFAVFAITPLAFSASKIELQNTENILDFLDKNSTSADEFQTKTVQLALNDSDRSLFDRESYRKTSRGKKAKVVATKPGLDQDKPPLTVTRGDYSMTFGGSTKVEHFFQRNKVLLNKNIPDECEYFKNTFDMIFDLDFGQKRFGHKAAQVYLDLTHKGVWGRNGTFADSEPSAPTQLKMSDSFFGNHSHSNGRPFVWFREAWLSLSLSAVADKETETPHTVKVGYFPFEVGRGIGLGSYYGLSRGDQLGFYSYAEEKAAPGICISGEIVHDRVSYDVYFSRFEERNKDLKDTTGLAHGHYTPAPALPWRGLGKDNDVVAGRLKIAALKNDRGSLNVEPYIVYNSAPDQKVHVIADSDVKFGVTGLNIEHACGDFEWGGEAAVNFGKMTRKAIDTNVTEIFRGDDGRLAERYTKIVQWDPVRNERTKNKVMRSLAVDGVVDQLDYLHKDLHIPAPGRGYDMISTDDRFRKDYEAKFGGWMGVLDAAYTFKDLDIKFALGGGYASGDKDPDMEQENKTYKGFVGLNECYNGKRIKSILVLDERSISRPVIFSKTNVEADKEMSFTNMAFGGFNALWTPRIFGKKWSVNPNCLFFWNAHQEDKPVVAADGGVTFGTPGTDKASKFLGTELNLLTRVEVLKDFSVFANLAFFKPGQFFKDFSGIKLGRDEYFEMARDNGEEGQVDPKNFRLGSNNAYHVNVGFTYKF